MIQKNKKLNKRTEEFLTVLLNERNRLERLLKFARQQVYYLELMEKQRTCNHPLEHIRYYSDEYTQVNICNLCQAEVSEREVKQKEEKASYSDVPF